jgi:hypothetical protein
MCSILLIWIVNERACWLISIRGWLQPIRSALSVGTISYFRYGLYDRPCFDNGGANFFILHRETKLCLWSKEQASLSHVALSSPVLQGKDTEEKCYYITVGKKYPIQLLPLLVPHVCTDWCGEDANVSVKVYLQCVTARSPYLYRFLLIEIEVCRPCLHAHARLDSFLQMH